MLTEKKKSKEDRANKMAGKKSVGNTNKGWDVVEDEGVISIKNLSKINIFWMIKGGGVSSSFVDDNFGNGNTRR